MGALPDFYDFVKAKGQDQLITGLKGLASLPQMAIGLADIPTGGGVGKWLEEDFDINFERAQKNLSSNYSPSVQEGMQNIEQAKGFWNSVGEFVENPEAAAHIVSQSLIGSKGAGSLGKGLGYGAKALSSKMAQGAVGRGALKSFGDNALVQAATGEGLLMAGSAAEQMRYQTPERDLSVGQSLLAGATGIAGAKLSMLGGKMAEKLGVIDPDVAIMGGATQATKKQGIARAFVGGGIAEGAFEEMPQSIMEQGFQNIGLGKPILEGIPEAAGMGLVSGLAMGGPMSGANRLGEVIKEKSIVNEVSGQFDSLKIQQQEIANQKISQGTLSKDLTGKSPTLGEQKLGTDLSIGDQRVEEKKQEALSTLSINPSVFQAAKIFNIDPVQMNEIVDSALSASSTAKEFKLNLDSQLGGNSQGVGLSLWNKLKEERGSIDFSNNLSSEIKNKDYLGFEQSKDVLPKVYSETGAKLFPAHLKGEQSETLQAISGQQGAAYMPDRKKGIDELIAEAGYKLATGADITAKTGQKIHASTNHADKSIKFNVDVALKKYQEKAWTKPYTQIDGSSATPLPENAFSTFTAFRDFSLAHELAHSYVKIGENETRGAYEDRINQEAFSVLKTGKTTLPTQEVASEPAYMLEPADGNINVASQNPDLLATAKKEITEGKTSETTLNAIRKAYGQSSGQAQKDYLQVGKEYAAAHQLTQGINIYSGSKDELGRALTNPTHHNPKNAAAVSSKRGGLGKYSALDNGIEYNGKRYADVEEAYFANKETTKDRAKLIEKIIVAKLQQYPLLVEDIDKRGGIDFLNKSFHTYGKPVDPTKKTTQFWTSDGQDAFMIALRNAYTTVKSPAQIPPTSTFNSQNKQAVADLLSKNGHVEEDGNGIWKPSVAAPQESLAQEFDRYTKTIGYKKWLEDKVASKGREEADKDLKTLWSERVQNAANRNQGLSLGNFDQKTGEVSIPKDSPLRSIKGFERVITGGHDVYIELSGVPEGSTGGQIAKMGQYYNHSYKGEKVYLQKQEVNYAPYKPGKAYIKIDAWQSLPNRGGLSQFVLHSGGAKGSDSYWGEVGSKLGVTEKHYHAEGEKTPRGNVAIPKAELLSSDKAIILANKTLGRKFPTTNDYVNNLLRRNAWQVNNSDTVFAVGEIENEKTVKGGTGWAVQMAVDSNKPVYVFDQKQNGWFKYDGAKFVKTETPRLTNNFAGIGTRELNENGKRAIREVYALTAKDGVQRTLKPNVYFDEETKTYKAKPADKIDKSKDQMASPQVDIEEDSYYEKIADYYETGDYKTKQEFIDWTANTIRSKYEEQLRNEKHSFDKAPNREELLNKYIGNFLATKARDYLRHFVLPLKRETTLNDWAHDTKDIPLIKSFTNATSKLLASLLKSKNKVGKAYTLAQIQEAASEVYQSISTTPATYLSQRDPIGAMKYELKKKAFAKGLAKRLGADEKLTANLFPFAHQAAIWRLDAKDKEAKRQTELNINKKNVPVKTIDQVDVMSLDGATLEFDALPNWKTDNDVFFNNYKVPKNSTWITKRLESLINGSLTIAQLEEDVKSLVSQYREDAQKVKDKTEKIKKSLIDEFEKESQRSISLAQKLVDQYKGDRTSANHEKAVLNLLDIQKSVEVARAAKIKEIEALSPGEIYKTTKNQNVADWKKVGVTITPKGGKPYYVHGTSNEIDILLKALHPQESNDIKPLVAHIEKMAYQAKKSGDIALFNTRMKIADGYRTGKIKIPNVKERVKISPELLKEKAAYEKQEGKKVSVAEYGALKLSEWRRANSLSPVTETEHLAKINDNMEEAVDSYFDKDYEEQENVNDAGIEYLSALKEFFDDYKKDDNAWEGISDDKEEDDGYGQGKRSSYSNRTFAKETQETSQAGLIAQKGAFVKTISQSIRNSLAMVLDRKGMGSNVETKKLVDAFYRGDKKFVGKYWDEIEGLREEIILEYSEENEKEFEKMVSAIASNAKLLLQFASKKELDAMSKEKKRELAISMVNELDPSLEGAQIAGKDQDDEIHNYPLKSIAEQILKEMGASSFATIKEDPADAILAVREKLKIGEAAKEYQGEKAQEVELTETAKKLKEEFDKIKETATPQEKSLFVLKARNEMLSNIIQEQEVYDINSLEKSRSVKDTIQVKEVASSKEPSLDDYQDDDFVRGDVKVSMYNFFKEMQLPENQVVKSLVMPLLNFMQENYLTFKGKDYNLAQIVKKFEDSPYVTEGFSSLENKGDVLARAARFLSLSSSFEATNFNDKEYTEDDISFVAEMIDRSHSEGSYLPENFPVAKRWEVQTRQALFEFVPRIAKTLRFSDRAKDYFIEKQKTSSDKAEKALKDFLALLQEGVNAKSPEDSLSIWSDAFKSQNGKFFANIKDMKEKSGLELKSYEWDNFFKAIEEHENLSLDTIEDIRKNVEASMIASPAFFDNYLQYLDALLPDINKTNETLKGPLITVPTPEDLFDVYVRNGADKNAVGNYVNDFVRKVFEEKARQLKKEFSGEKSKEAIKEYVSLELSPKEREVLESMMSEKVDTGDVMEGFRVYEEGDERHAKQEAKDSSDLGIIQRGRVNAAYRAYRLLTGAIKAKTLKQAVAKEEHERWLADNSFSLPEGMAWEDLAKREKVDAFEKFLKKSNKGLEIRTASSIQRKVYTRIAEFFDADLVFVKADNYTSRFIPKEAWGKAKIVINVNSKDRSVYSVIAHEIFHAVVAKSEKAAYRKFKEAIIKEAGQDKWDTAVKAATKKGGNEQDVLAELFSHSMGSEEFYKTLSKSFEGKTLAQRLISRLLMLVRKFANLTTNKDFDVDDKQFSVKLFKGSEMEKIHKLFISFVQGDVKVKLGTFRPRIDMGQEFNSVEIDSLLSAQKGARTANKPFGLDPDFDKELFNNTYYMTPLFGEVTKNEVEGWVKEPKTWLQGVWSKIFAPGTKNYKDVMTNIEGMLADTILWIKEHKWGGAWADFNADDASAMLLYRTNNSYEKKVFEVSQTRNFSHVFAKWSIQECAEFYDNVLKNKVDVTTDRGAAKLKLLGYSNEVIEALKSFKEEADIIFEKLEKIHPEIRREEFHYGLSLEWMKPNQPRRSELDFTENDLYSKLVGEGISLNERTTTSAKNMLEYGWELKEFDPQKVFMKYVNDAYKLIGFYEMREEGQKLFTANGKTIFAKFKTDKEAIDAGYYVVNDPLMSVREDISKAYRITVMDKGVKKYAPAIYSSQEQADAEVELLNSEQHNRAFIRENKVAELQFRLDELGEDESVSQEIEKLKGVEKHEYSVEVLPIKGAERQTKEAGRIYAQKDAARMLTVMLKKDMIRSSWLGENLMLIKNAMTSVLYSLSGFHAATMGQEAVAAIASWFQGKRPKGDKNILVSAWEKRHGFNLAAIKRDAEKLQFMTEALTSDPTLKEKQAFKDEYNDLLLTDDVDINDALDKFFMAGGLMHRDASLRSGAHGLGNMKYVGHAEGAFKINSDGSVVRTKEKFATANISQLQSNLGAIKHSFSEVVEESLRREPNKSLKAMFKAGKFAIFEATTAWLMEYAIPRLKFLIFMREYTLRLEKFIAREGRQPTEVEKAAIAIDVMKFVEDRVGEVNWKNQWMNPTFKSALQFSFGSFTWRSGTWKALSKAGVDLVKAGWVTIKDGKRFEPTEKGMWFLNALLAYFATVGLINAVYAIALGISGGGEVPDDEEVPALTRMMFARIDPNDPSSRIAIPSYITEAYKIAMHLGLTGSEAEAGKIITGGTSVMITRAWESLVTGEDWRGVRISNEDDGFLHRVFDKTKHVLFVPPISVSTAMDAWNQKGVYGVQTIGLASVGVTGAPAAALRSDATNKAFEIRRRENKGREISQEEMDVKDKIRLATYLYKMGDKQKLEDMLSSGEISENQFKKALKKIEYIGGAQNPDYIDPLSSALKGLTIRGAIDVWHYMSENEKRIHKKEIFKKYSNMMSRKDKSPKEKTEIRLLMQNAGIL